MEDPFDDFEEDGTDTVFRDVIMLALIGFVAMVIMLLPHISREKQETKDDNAPATSSSRCTGPPIWRTTSTCG